jgi:uncharacterized metal-binding protein
MGFNLASAQALACSDGILDTAGVFARRSFTITDLEDRLASGTRE